MAADKPIRDWDQVRIDLAITEASLSLLSVGQSPGKKKSDAAAPEVQSARSWYESLIARRKYLVLTPKQAAILDEALDRLRARLELLSKPL